MIISFIFYFSNHKDDKKNRITNGNYLDYIEFTYTTDNYATDYRSRLFACDFYVSAINDYKITDLKIEGTISSGELAAYSLEINYSKKNIDENTRCFIKSDHISYPLTSTSDDFQPTFEFHITSISGHYDKVEVTE